MLKTLKTVEFPQTSIYIANMCDVIPLHEYSKRSSWGCRTPVYIFLTTVHFLDFFTNYIINQKPVRQSHEDRLEDYARNGITSHMHTKLKCQFNSIIVYKYKFLFI